MTELRVEPYVIPAANLGPENPLPQFRDPLEDPGPSAEAHALPSEDREGLGWQTGFRVLPYRMQDGYTRALQPRTFTSIVLENAHLRVRVLPEAGGRVDSIWDKASGRDLIECNPVYQPANLALRNAWASGGIEWNVAQVGHNCLTCSPVHAARVRGPEGQPVLRLYAWERVRAFPFQIDLDLPPDSRFLYARIRVINPHAAILPMYWWTNLAVPEREGQRVLMPADTAYYSSGQFERLPYLHGQDASYTTELDHSYHVFGRLEAEQRPWVAVVDEDGKGFAETSTMRLRGRKLFAWGQGPGPRRWQEFLSADGHAYLELQAGLSRTQHHMLRMPGQTEWTWTEAFGPFIAEPQKAHSSDWHEAWSEGERALEAALPCAELETRDGLLAEVTVRAPEELLFRGLGWGALERHRAAVAGEPSPIPAELPFEDGDLGEEQAPWLELLQTGALPEREPESGPGHYMIQPEWQGLLEQAIAQGASDHWLGWLHLGVMAVEAQKVSVAEEHFRKSRERRATSWAARNLARLALREGRAAAGCDLLAEAWDAGPRPVQLAIEYGNELLRAKRYEELQALLGSLEPSHQEHERIRLLQVRLAMHEARPEEALRLLDYDFAYIREGETSVWDLWVEAQALRLAQAEGVEVNDELRERGLRECPPPRHLDFRMFVKPADRYVAPDAEE